MEVPPPQRGEVSWTPEEPSSGLRRLLSQGTLLFGAAVTRLGVAAGNTVVFHNWDRLRNAAWSRPPGMALLTYANHTSMFDEGLFGK